MSNNTEAITQQTLNESMQLKLNVNKVDNLRNDKYINHNEEHLKERGNDPVTSVQKSILTKIINKMKFQKANYTERRLQLKRYLNDDDDVNVQQTNSTLKTNVKPHYSDQWKLRTRQLDTYAESLLYVNRIYNMAYGFERRRVPAHMPHLIDKWIVADMQLKFEHEFKKTSSHKVRNSGDMQFAFSYFYFLASEKRKMPIEEIFDTFDTDKTGYDI